MKSYFWDKNIKILKKCVVESIIDMVALPYWRGGYISEINVAHCIISLSISKAINYYTNVRMHRVWFCKGECWILIGAVIVDENNFFRLGSNIIVNGN